MYRDPRHAFRAAMCTALLMTLPAQGGDFGNRNFRQEMRDFVKALGAYARATDPDFIVIPQNGQELITTNGESDGPLAAGYVATINGQGREDLFYGYEEDNVATPEGESEYIIEFLDRCETEGVTVLVTDYCSTPAFMDDSYMRNAAKGYASFAADRRELDNVPTYPGTPVNQNTADVTTLTDVRNFLYLLDPGPFPSKAAYLNTLVASSYDLFILDLFYEEALTPADLASLRTKPDGGSRLRIAYMSIGEAEDYRDYWQPEWGIGNPSWIIAANPNFEGAYKVAYWDPEWQAIVYGNAGAYLDQILAAGFDGVYLDIIDGFEFFEELTGEGEGEGGEGEGEGCAPGPLHTADTNRNGRLSLSETMRVIQFYNVGGLHCAATSTEDGFVPGTGGDQTCCTHDADYNAQDWHINLHELLRVIQLYNSNGYTHCPMAMPLTEDGYCPGS